MIDSNPKCQVISNFKNDGSEPAVEVVFSECNLCLLFPIILAQLNTVKSPVMTTSL